MKLLTRLIWSKFIIAGLTMLLVFYGYSYFEDHVLAITYEAIQNNLILKILSDFLASYLFILGGILALMGITGLFLVCRERGEFLKEFGKSLYLPPIIGAIASLIYSFLITGTTETFDIGFVLQPGTYLNKQFVLNVGIFLFGVLMHAWGRKRAKETHGLKEMLLKAKK